MIITKYANQVDRPVSLDEVKLHLRVTSTTEDELIKTIIDAATGWCEEYERQSYMIKTYKIYLDEFPSVDIFLPFSPAISVTSIQYYDTSDSLQTVSSSYYTLDKDSMPARIYLNYAYNWPATYFKKKSVIITYTAGYATTFSSAYSTDLITVGNAVFSDTDRVQVSTDKGDLPSPLNAMTDYYIRDVSGSTCKLAATSGGSAVNLADDGAGTHYIGFADKGLVPSRVKAAIKLLAGDMYENRQQGIDFSLSMSAVTVQSLLSERLFL